MTNENSILKTVIDIGNGYIKGIIGEISADGEWVRALSYAKIKTKGLKKSHIDEPNMLRKSIEKLLDKFRIFGEITTVTIGINGSQIGTKRKDKIVHLFPKDTISKKHIEDIYAEAQKEVPEGMEVICREIYNIYVDTVGPKRNPIGMEGSSLSACVYCVYTSESETNQYRDIFRKCGVQVENIVYGPGAATRAVFTREEERAGVALIDIGEGTTKISFIKNGKLIHTASMPVGAWNFVNDLAILLHNQKTSKPLNNLDDAKVIFDKYVAMESGHVNIIEDNNKDTIEIYERVSCNVSEIKEILDARVEDIALTIKKIFDEASFLSHLTKGVSITGGISGFLGLAEKISSHLGYRVKKKKPIVEMSGLEKLDDEMAVVTGLFMQTMGKEYSRIVSSQKSKDNTNGYSSVSDKLDGLDPEDAEGLKQQMVADVSFIDEQTEEIEDTEANESAKYEGNTENTPNNEETDKTGNITNAESSRKIVISDDDEDLEPEQIAPVELKIHDTTSLLKSEDNARDLNEFLNVNNLTVGTDDISAAEKKEKKPGLIGAVKKWFKMNYTE